MKINKKISVIGVGKMGGAIVSSLINNAVMDREDIFGTTSCKETSSRVKEKYQIETGTDNLMAVKKSEIIILTVEPQLIEKVLEQLKPALNKNKIIVSVIAAISTSFIEDQLKEPVPVIRAMTNTASLINEGMTVLCSGSFVEKEQLELISKIFQAIGRVEIIYKENLMDVVTALAGGGPAYSYTMIESLTDGGVRMGLPRKLARILAAQSVLGGAKMILHTGMHPAVLKDEITTPAGVTVDGLMELEDGKFRASLIRAIEKATKKSRKISR